MLMASALTAHAFDLSTYTTQSVLASGRWVKISVPESGVYALSAATLRSMGFSDPRKVRIYGYGGARIPDRLSLKSYIDDLPPVQSSLTSSGAVIFYAQGPDKWTLQNEDYATKSLNIYTTSGSYFVTETDSESSPVPEIPLRGTPGAENPASSFIDRIHHEQNLISPGEAGAPLVGEDFRYTPSRNFSFSLPDRVQESKVWMGISFVAKTHTRSSTLEFSANSTPLQQSLSIGTTINETYYHGCEAVGNYKFDLEGENLNLGLKYSSPVTINGAWLNYLCINYERRLKLPSSGLIAFWSRNSSLCLSGIKSSAKPTVWDVTDPANIFALNTSDVQDGTVSWTFTGGREMRSFVAFSDDAKIPQPTVVGVVQNQNLHAIETADMIILTHPAWRAQAQQIADIHTSDPIEPLDVHVIDVAQVYNEFASGEADPSAIRKFLKMLYDRGIAAGKPLRFALLMARATYDNAAQTAEFRNLNIRTMPTWYSDLMYASLNDKTGYGCDDFMAMLGDNSGAATATDSISIALGRIPVTSAAEASSYIDKLSDYINKSKRTPWKNKFMLLADDQDNAVHVNQAESVAAILNPEDAPNFVIDKIYMDAYDRQGSSYPDARQAMFRALDDGVMFWIYLGHANNHSWTHDGQLTYNDINNMYLKHLPVLFAGTCDFMRWDSNTISGAEIMFNERYGGTIAIISATRPVYISDNGMYADAIARALVRRRHDGSMFRAGEYYAMAKNDIRDSDGRPTSNSNRLRYVFMGDPAMRLTMPQNFVTLSSIDGVDVSPEATSDPDSPQAVIAALQQPVLEGYISDTQGNPIPSFNGTVYIDIYDAELSNTTKGYGNDGAKVPFQQHGGKLFTGIFPVTDGKFAAKITMPSEISDNFTPALVNMYASSSDLTQEAIGVSNSLYVFGFDDSADSDTIPPVIESIYLNHSSFSDGALVNTTPTLIAQVSDNVGINISMAGIGHQMTLTLDGKKTFNDVASFFKPADDGSPAGSISYPLDQLTTGPHSLSFRVWDTAGNASSQTLSFQVSDKVAPKIYDIYTDTNPASSQANFYLSSDRPDQMVTVTVTVYNLMGQPLWTKKVTGINDMFTSTPVVWDLTDSAGRRVPRGIYLYRATISDNGVSYDTAAQRVAVTAY